MNLLEAATTDIQLQTFLRVTGIREEDLHILREAADDVRPFLPEVVALLVQNLEAEVEVMKRLQSSHQDYFSVLAEWLNLLFTGPHDGSFLIYQEKIGEQHVQQKIPPLYNAFIMSFLRAALPNVMGKHGISQRFPEGQLTAATLRLLDLCQFVIDRAYTVRLLAVTGISKTLLDRLMTA